MNELEPTREEKREFLTKQMAAYQFAMYRNDVQHRIAERLDDKKMKEEVKKTAERTQMAIDVLEEDLKALDSKEKTSE